MLKQIYLNLLISLIIAISISYYYYRKINNKSLLTFFIIFLLTFVIFYYLGPNNTVESFNNMLNTQEEVLNLLEDPVSIISKNPNLTNVQEEVTTNIQEEVTPNIQEEVTPNIQEELAYTSEENYATVNNEEMSEELNQEQESNQEEILNQQEEYIRNVVDEEMIEEEDNNDVIKKKVAAKKSLSDSSNILSKTITGNDNQINPGIGIGVSPVNIFINGNEVDVDKFKNNKGKHSKKKDEMKEKLDHNYYKNGSRIYNNCDWVYDKNEWCDETYNYDKNSCGSNNNLLPCVQPKVNKIPQTLNNLMNTKKNNKKSEPCPLDVNKPWSIYKTGDDKETNKLIPEGFNL